MSSQDPLSDPSKFVPVSLTGATLQHPSQANAAQGAPVHAQSPQAFLAESADAAFTPAPKQAPTNNGATATPAKTKRQVVRSDNMKRLFQAFGLRQVQHEVIEVKEGLTITVRALGKEDLIWATEKTNQHKYTGMLANEQVYTIATAAIAAAAINEEPIYLSLGILTEAEANAYPIKDVLYPPKVVRIACAEMFFDMLAGDAGEESLLEGVAETIAVAWESKIQQRIDEIVGPLEILRRTLRGLPEATTAISEAASPQSSEQPSTIPESPTPVSSS